MFHHTHMPTRITNSVVAHSHRTPIKTRASGPCSFPLADTSWTLQGWVSEPSVNPPLVISPGYLLIPQLPPASVRTRRASKDTASSSLSQQTTPRGHNPNATTGTATHTHTHTPTVTSPASPGAGSPGAASAYAIIVPGNTPLNTPREAAHKQQQQHSTSLAYADTMMIHQSLGLEQASMSIATPREIKSERVRAGPATPSCLLVYIFFIEKMFHLRFVFYFSLRN